MHSGGKDARALPTFLAQLEQLPSNKRLIKSVASRLLTSWPIAPQARYMLPRPARLLASHNRNNTLAGMARLRGRMRAHRGREKSKNFHANEIKFFALLIVSFWASPPAAAMYYSI